MSSRTEFKGKHCIQLHSYREGHKLCPPSGFPGSEQTIVIILLIPTHSSVSDHIQTQLDVIHIYSSSLAFNLHVAMYHRLFTSKTENLGGSSSPFFIWDTDYLKMTNPPTLRLA